MSKLQIQVVAVIAALLGIADEWFGTGIIGLVGQEVIETIIVAILGVLPLALIG